jgi:hypothetical protein
MSWHLQQVEHPCRLGTTPGGMLVCSRRSMWGEGLQGCSRSEPAAGWSFLCWLVAPAACYARPARAAVAASSSGGVSSTSAVWRALQQVLCAGAWRLRRRFAAAVGVGQWRQGLGVSPGAL